ncbi:M10 family metallopeptidase C-terminal domain-containing protein [Pseudomonas costantinii]|uniref:M10 family metallopeptidase C-terminal domain-containing protein n=1 Tax=Pseudomonas costantinii TaxID=168469 RepID=UPI0015A19244|nr:M10 family metallopeptidase C-terminal domain-containing protein [Pseudomonas costantinii]NVZ72861.1 M10 family metallopeptidase C-terminal domain-containing protein [Pseudomonas costantinii]
MSTISLPSRAHTESPPGRPHSQPTHLSSVAVSPKALDALLQSGPNNTVEQKRPDEAMATANQATTERELNDLCARLDRKMVDRMMREPESKESKANFDKISTLLTPDNIKCLLQGPNATSCTQLLAKIETQLNKNSTDTVLKPIEAEQVEAYRKYVDAALFNLKANLMKAAPGSRFEMVRNFSRQKHAPLTSIQDYMKDLEAKSKHLCDIATQVRKVNEPLQYAHLDDWDRRDHYGSDCKQHPKTYSFTHASESTLDRPSEIRNFVTDRDKLDVTGIRRQLNKPLQWVNQLSGASGEIQLKYSRPNNASVLVISGNQGEPAFVAKIFGQVKEKDLLT